MPAGSQQALSRPRVGESVQYFTRESEEQFWGSEGGPYAAIVTKVREGSLAALAVFTPFAPRIRAVGWVRHRSEAGDATRWWQRVDEGMLLFATSNEGEKSYIEPARVARSRGHAPRLRRQRSAEGLLPGDMTHPGAGSLPFSRQSIGRESEVRFDDLEEWPPDDDQKAAPLRSARAMNARRRPPTFSQLRLI